MCACWQKSKIGTFTERNACGESFPARNTILMPHMSQDIKILRVQLTFVVLKGQQYKKYRCTPTDVVEVAPVDSTGAAE